MNDDPDRQTEYSLLLNLVKTLRLCAKIESDNRYASSGKLLGNKSITIEDQLTFVFDDKEQKLQAVYDQYAFGIYKLDPDRVAQIKEE